MKHLKIFNKTFFVFALIIFINQSIFTSNSYGESNKLIKKINEFYNNNYDIIAVAQNNTQYDYTDYTYKDTKNPENGNSDNNNNPNPNNNPDNNNSGDNNGDGNNGDDNKPGDDTNKPDLNNPDNGQDPNNPDNNDNGTVNKKPNYFCEECACENYILGPCVCNKCVNTNKSDPYYSWENKFGLNNCKCELYECEEIDDNESNRDIPRNCRCVTTNCQDNAIKELKDKFDKVEDYAVCENDYDILDFPQNTYLEKCIREFTGNTRWPFSCKEAKNIRHIKCKADYITSLDGIQQFPNLETIDMGNKGTKIKDLSPIRNLVHLKRIEIPNSEIDDTAYLVFLDNVTLLNLRGNHITDMRYIPYMSGLSTLALDFQSPNFITDISPFNNMRGGISKLSLQGNKITDISPLANFNNLEYLTIQDNRIGSIAPLANKPHLTEINMSVNLISDISPLNSNRNLTTIYADFNKISSIEPLDNMTEVRVVSFKGNNISNIAPISNKRHLKTMAFDFNNITDISSIYEIQPTSDILYMSFTYNCIPKSSIKKIRFKELIQSMHFENQCISYDSELENYINGNNIVNPDIVIGSNYDVFESDNFSKKRDENTGLGCSIAYGNKAAADIIVIFTLVFFIFKFGYNLIRRK